MLSVKFLKALEVTTLSMTLGWSSAVVSLASAPKYEFSSDTYSESNDIDTSLVGFPKVINSGSSSEETPEVELSSTITLTIEKRLELNSLITAKAIMGDDSSKSSYSLNEPGNTYSGAVDVSTTSAEKSLNDFNKEAWAHCFDGGSDSKMKFEIKLGDNAVSLLKDESTSGGYLQYHGDSSGFSIKSFKAEIEGVGVGRSDYNPMGADTTSGYLVLTWEIAVDGVNDVTNALYEKEGEYTVDRDIKKFTIVESVVPNWYTSTAGN